MHHPAYISLVISKYTGVRDNDALRPMARRNTTREACCELCIKNATCAFALHRATDGMCWPAPAHASGWTDGKPGITTCRITDAPAWPPARVHLPLWPAPRGAATAGGVGTARFAGEFAVCCVGPGCPSASALAWYQQRVRDSAAAHVALSPTVNGSTGSVSSVVVEVGGAGMAALRPEMNESYSLRCAGDRCTVRSSHGPQCHFHAGRATF